MPVQVIDRSCTLYIGQYSRSISVHTPYSPHVHVRRPAFVHALRSDVLLYGSIISYFPNVCIKVCVQTFSVELFLYLCEIHLHTSEAKL